MIAKHCSGDMEQWQNNFSQMLDLTNDFCGNFFLHMKKKISVLSTGCIFQMLG